MLSLTDRSLSAEGAGGSVEVDQARIWSSAAGAPVIAFDDADLDSVVSGLRAFSFYNAGQTVPPLRVSTRPAATQAGGGSASAASSPTTRATMPERDPAAHFGEASRARLRFVERAAAEAAEIATGATPQAARATIMSQQSSPA
jgi:acyl-CoA reductase-like NAD-dependent aldehyde dehydrogenase